MWHRDTVTLLILNTNAYFTPIRFHSLGAKLQILFIKIFAEDNWKFCVQAEFKYKTRLGQCRHRPQNGIDPTDQS